MTPIEDDAKPQAPIRSSAILKKPATRDDCVLDEEHEFVNMREVYQVLHRAWAEEAAKPSTEATHNERVRTLSDAVNRAEDILGDAYIKMIRARMDSGIHVVD